MEFVLASNGFERTNPKFRDFHRHPTEKQSEKSQVYKHQHRIIPEVFSMNSCELTAAVTAVANTLAYKLSNNELTLLASVLVQLGDTLVTIATQRTICENINEKE